MSSKRKWTIEKFEEEVLPLISASVGAHIRLPIRESVILTSAMIDAGLAQLISKKLRGSEHDIVEFLGADGDGRAPCGTFGSRIQLVRLLGIFVDEDVALLRQLKRLRNEAAHRITFTADDPATRDELTKLWELLLPAIKNHIRFWKRALDNQVILLEGADARFVEAMKTLAAHVPMINEIYQGLRDGLRDADETLRDVLPTENTIGSDLTPVFSTLDYIPSLILKHPSVASMIMVVLLHLYQTRIRSLIATMRPFAQTELPTEIVKFWESDLSATRI